MELFNLRKIAMALSFILAITPVMDVAAAVALSASQAATIFEDLTQSKDVDSLLTAAGVPAGTLYTSLELSFNTAATNYKSASSMTASKIQSIFSKYQTDCQNLATVIAAYQNPANSIVAGQNVAAVNNAMQDLATFMGALFPHLQDGYMNNKTSGAINGMVLPLTNVGLAMANLPAGQTADQYYANIFVNEMAAWLPIQVAETAGRNNISNLSSLALAASQLQLLTTTTPAQAAASLPQQQAAQLMLNVITAAQCASSATIQAQITCGVNWYNNLLSTINKNIGLVSTATTNLNNVVSVATKAIGGVVTLYNPQITVATTQAAKIALYNTAVTAINTAYEPLIGTTGSIETQNTAAMNAETAINAGIQTLSAVPSTPLVATQASLVSVAGAFTTAINATDPEYPQSLPAAGLNITSASNPSYAASVPGAAILSLASTAGVLTPTQAATANASALNTAVASVGAIFTADQKNAIAAINAAVSQSAAQTALNTGLAQVNVDYNNNIVLTTSNYSKALAAANASLVVLNGLPSNTTGLAAAQTILQTAISAANKALPVLAAADKAIGFTVANSAVGAAYGASVPGIAVTAINATYTSYKAPASGGGGLSPADIAGIITALLGALGIAGLAAWLKTQAGQEAVEEEAASPDVVEKVQSLSEDLQESLKEAANSYNTDSGKAMDDFLAGNPDALQFAQKAITDSYQSANNIQDSNAEGLEKLINENTTNNDWDGFKSAMTTTDVQLTSLTNSNGFTADDVLTMIDPANGYLPDGFTGTSAEALSTISTAITSNNIQKGTGSLKDLQTQISEITNASSGPGGPGGDVPGINTGEALPENADTSTFNEMVQSNTLSQQTIEDDIKSGAFSETSLEDQLQALADELKDAPSGSEQANTEETAIEEGEAAGKAEYPDFVDPVDL